MSDGAGQSTDTLPKGNGQAVVDDIEKSKAFINQARGAVEADISAINAAKARFESLKDVAETKLNELQTAQSTLQTNINEATKKYDQLKKLGDDLEKIKTGAEQAKASVDANIKAISETKTAFEALKTETDAKVQEVQTAQNTLKGKIDDIGKKHDSIAALHKRLLEDVKDEGGNVTTPSMQTNIDALHKNLKTQFSNAEQKMKTLEKEFGDLKVKLEGEIRSLLPSAGAAGLAHAYFDAKGRYGTVPYEPSNKDHWLVLGAKKTLHYIKSSMGTAFYYALFMLPLIAIFDLFIGKIFFTPIDLGAIDKGAFFLRLVIATPLALLSYFGFSSIALNRRLFEEYNHKQRVMELYRSFKQEIEGEGTKEQKQELINIMLQVVSSRPSLVMSQYDKGLRGMFSGLFGKNVSDEKETPSK